MARRFYLYRAGLELAGQGVDMELRDDTLVDLKFIMADTGFGKTFIYDRVKDGTLCKPIKISGRSRWKYRDHIEFKNKLISGCNG